MICAVRSAQPSPASAEMAKCGPFQRSFFSRAWQTAARSSAATMSSLLKTSQRGLANSAGSYFFSSFPSAPKFATPGEEGEQKRLRLELKVLADVGLLGMPNAGKSTLIAAVSNARPKIADYPFTTLHPNLGVVRVGPERSFVIADIPGLIEGAADGAGLGHQFLRHLQRTRLLLHVIDVAPFDPEADPVRDAKAIVKELKRYDPALAAKHRWVVLNKTDMLDPALGRGQLDRLRKGLRLPRGTACFEVSALTGEGLRPLTFAIMDFIASQNPKEPEAPDVRFSHDDALP
ncbi:MAG: hypothetical protein EBX69_11535 [Betaproteobacteria bacterium]|nr:hypothetical protein [Betaproteobacteria bacterium]